MDGSETLFSFCVWILIFERNFKLPICLIDVIAHFFELRWVHLIALIDRVILQKTIILADWYFSRFYLVPGQVIRNFVEFLATLTTHNMINSGCRALVLAQKLVRLEINFKRWTRLFWQSRVSKSRTLMDQDLFGFMATLFTMNGWARSRSIIAERLLSVVVPCVVPRVEELIVDLITTISMFKTTGLARLE